MREEKFDPKQVYRFDPKTGTFFIDIDLDFYRELYSEWDFSPQHNRDLDEDLLEYLSDCCDEIPNRSSLCISMSLPQAAYDPQKEERARQGFYNFFRYQVRREKNRSRSYYAKIAKFLFLGTLLLILATSLDHLLSDIKNTEILTEGLIIGAWVSIWEVFSIIFFKLSEHRQRINTYRRLQQAKIIYRYRPDPP
ncbi:hypothetical protein [Malonomonas rubra]|uniref:hypothetical protein n=1 Tax=Malonomonas rubra TaxID=57040 RepID=UPI0026EC3335|nr:hypothetical protein [Malonomonas rubra]